MTPAKPKYTLDELLKNATPQMQHEEVDFGELVGEEIGHIQHLTISDKLNEPPRNEFHGSKPKSIKMD